MEANKDLLEKVKDEEGKKLEMLKSPELIPLIIKEVHKEVVREDDTIIALININWVRLVNNPHPTSSNVAINAFTRAGKDWTAKHTYKVLMEPDKNIHRSYISAKVFTYWHHKEDDWTWDGKQLHLEDVTSVLVEGEVFKCMSSGSNVATVVVNQTAIDFEIPGKPNMTITGFNLDFNSEALGRYPIIHIDESDEQTRAIKIHQSKKAKGLIDNKPNQLLRYAIQQNLSLKKVEVIVPFAEALVELFPDIIIMRDVFNRFLDYIKASAAGHRYQREKDEHKRIIATYDDYLIARITMMKTYNVSSMVSTSKNDEKVIEFLKDKQGANKKDISSVVSNYYIYETKGLDKLEDNGIISSDSVWDDKANKYTKRYFLISDEKKMVLPMFPDGIEVKQAKKDLIKEICDCKNLSSKVATKVVDAPYNTSGVLVLWYLKKLELINIEQDKSYKIRKTKVPGIERYFDYKTYQIGILEESKLQNQENKDLSDFDQLYEQAIKEKEQKEQQFQQNNEIDNSKSLDEVCEQAFGKIKPNKKDNEDDYKDIEL